MSHYYWWNNKKVAVFGGLGFMGSNLIHKILQHGAIVKIFDSCDPDFGANLNNIRGFKNNISITRGDIRNFWSCADLIAWADVVVNCAAYISHAKSNSESKKCRDINDTGAMNLADAVMRFNPKALYVYPSTTSVVGPHEVDVLTEDLAYRPAEIYSASKAAVEMYLMAMAKRGLKVVIPRFANAYGPRSRMDANLTFMMYFVGLAMQGKELPVYGDGSQIRNPVYVDDCVEAIIRAATKPEAYGKPFFVAQDNHYQLVEIAQAIADEFGGPGVTHIPWPEGRKEIDAGNVIISNARCRELLGWVPDIDLGEGLRRTHGYFARG